MFTIEETPYGFFVYYGDDFDVRTDTRDEADEHVEFMEVVRRHKAI